MPPRRIPYKAIPWALVLGAVALTAATRIPNGPAGVPDRAPPPARAPAGATLWTEMRNVHLHIDQTAFMRLWLLRGQVVATAPGTVATLDEPTSFSIRLTAATVALDGEALSALMNE